MIGGAAERPAAGRAGGDRTEPHITLRPDGVAGALGAAALLLVLLSLAGQVAAHLTARVRVLGLVRLFYVDAERNVPTAFSTVLLLFAALLLGLVAMLKAGQTGSAAGHWAVLSAGFLLMAADEAFEFHEGLVNPVRRLLGDEDLGYLFFGWVGPALVLLVLVSLFFGRFVWRLPGRTRFAFVTAGTLYVGGAVGVEMIGGRFAELHGGDNLTYVVIVTIEESLEMAGVIVFIRALLSYLADAHEEVRLRFGRRGDRPGVPT